MICQHNVERLSLDNLLAHADHISFHTALRQETRTMLNAERLRKMKPTSFMLNTPRGSIIVTTAMTCSTLSRCRRIPRCWRCRT